MVRFGFGYDIHRFAPGRRLVLGGVHIPSELGLLGHSDADVLLHAICDALWVRRHWELASIFRILIRDSKGCRA
jgi:2-C-methyl-D-erythritol 2,4-cyclodiphosphate synthase